jgi:hypothetical protein
MRRSSKAVVRWRICQVGVSRQSHAPCSSALSITVRRRAAEQCRHREQRGIIEKDRCMYKYLHFPKSFQAGQSFQMEPIRGNNSWPRKRELPSADSTVEVTSGLCGGALTTSRRRRNSGPRTCRQESANAAVASTGAAVRSSSSARFEDGG